jgi:hypothetical protein
MASRKSNFKLPQVNDLLEIRENELLTTNLQLGEMHEKMHEVNSKLVEVQVAHGLKVQYLELNIEALESKNAQLQLLLDTAQKERQAMSQGVNIGDSNIEALSRALADKENSIIGLLSEGF